MASVSLEFSAFTDPRFKLLAKEMKIDHFSAIGRAQAVWMHCIEKNEDTLSEEFIDAAADLDGFCRAMIGFGLAEDMPNGGVRIRGTRGRIEWLGKCRAGKSAGGIARSKNAKRDGNGRFKPGPPTDNQLSVPGVPSPSTSSSTSFKNKKESLAQKSGDRPPIVLFSESVNQILNSRGVKSGVIEAWLVAYPDKSFIERKILQLVVWEEANPSRRKKNFARFVSNALSRDFDKRPAAPAANTTPINLADFMKEEA